MGFTQPVCRRQAAHLHNLQQAAAGVCIQLAALQKQQAGAHLHQNQNCGAHADALHRTTVISGCEARLPLPGAAIHMAIEPDNKTHAGAAAVLSRRFGGLAV